MVECLLTREAERWMTDVVGERKGLGKLCIETERIGKGAGDLCNFKRMREPAAEVIARWIGGQASEHLCLAGQTPERARVQYASSVAGKGAAVWVSRLVIYAACKISVAIYGDC
jgi:hypothetical protein